MSALVLAALVAAAPVPGAGADHAPTVTAQAYPAGRLLDTVKAFAKISGGDELEKVLTDSLKENLGEKGLTGIDLLRAPAGYAYLKPKLDESWGVIVVPVTTEKDFLELLARLDWKVAEKKGDAGLYDVTQPGLPFKEVEESVKFGLRFHDRHAYVAVNAPADGLAVKNLVPAGKLLDPAEQAPLAVKLYVERLDPAVKKLALGQLDEWEKDAGNPQPFVPGPIAAITGPGLKALKRNAGAVLADGDVLTARLAVDPATADVAYDFTLTAKKGTQLAKDIADRKPTTSRFAGVVPPTAVGGGVVQFPAFAPELRDATAALAEEAVKAAGENSNEAAKPVLDEVQKGLVRTLKAGDGELAAAMTGPAKDGKYTAVVAVAFDDPAAVEKALRGAVKDLPKAAQDAIKFDAAKAGGLSVHTVVVGSFLPPEAQKVFGESATLHVAFGPKAVYAAVGPDALAELGRVAALKPGPTRALDLVLNSKKALDVVKAVDEQAATNVGMVIVPVDKLLPFQYAEVRGGDALRVRYGSTQSRLASGAWLFGAR